MKQLRVWAPFAESVEAEVAGERTPMTSGEDGWWVLPVPRLPAGAEYAFVVDGSKPLPDPRSEWQPHGVHGPSRVLDHGAFPWTDAGFQQRPLSSAVIYELHVGTFTKRGTFDAVVDRLDHLVDLGVTHVELMPVNAFSGSRGWGYDGTGLFAPHEAYGGPDGLKRLVEACHARGLAVLLDVVYNHLGPEGNYLSQFGPYFTDHYKTPWGDAVNLDGAHSDEVRRFVIDNALHWLRHYHLDGLRIDAIHAIIDTSSTHILEQMATEVEALEGEIGRHLVLIAESDLNDPRVVRSRELGGHGMNAQWSDDFHHAVHAVLTGEDTGYYGDFGRLAHVAKALRQAFVYDGQVSEFRARRHGRKPEGLRGDRFLGYIQNHDQVGNRAQGDRLAHAAGVDRQKIGAAILFASPFVPMIFQGEEWATSSPFQYFTSHQDEHLAEAVRKGRRREFSGFGWNPESIPDPQAAETFERSKLRWDEVEQEPHDGVLSWYRDLIAIRHEIPALTDGRLDGVHVRYDEAERWLVIDRGPITVACNLAERPRTIPLDNEPHTLRVASKPGANITPEAVDTPPLGALVLQRTQ